MTEDEKQELLDTLRTMLDRMPQPHPVYRLSALIHAVVEASGLEWGQALKAMLMHIRLMENAPAATVVLRKDENPWRELADQIASEIEAKSRDGSEDLPH